MKLQNLYSGGLKLLLHNATCFFFKAEEAEREERKKLESKREEERRKEEERIRLEEERQVGLVVVTDGNSNQIGL